MGINQFSTIHFFLTEQSWNHIVNRTDGYKTYPTQRTGMHMADSPISIVAQSIDGFNRHHRTFKGRHTIERQRYDQEFQNRVGTQFMPCTGQGHNTVDHAAPRRCKQNQRKHHADRLSPIRQSGVVKMMRACPHIGKNQCPKVNDGQAVRINRTACLFRHIVIHHAQEAGSQEEAHGIMAIPPLNHCINCTGINRIRFH